MSKKQLQLQEPQNFRKVYNQVLDQTYHYIIDNCFIELGKCERIFINDYEITDYDDAFDVQKQIKKYIMQNKLFISGTKVEGDKVIIETTTDIYNLLFVPEIDEDNMKQLELEGIRQEIEKEVSIRE